MVNPKKKPPIDLNELAEEGLEEGEEQGSKAAQPGKLSYMEKPQPRYTTNEVVGGRDWKGLFGGVIVAVVLAGILIFVATPSKKDITTLQDNQKELVAQITSSVAAVKSAADAAVKPFTDQVNTAISEARSAKSSLAAYALKTDLSPYALKADTKVPDLSQYALKSELPAATDLSGYAKTTDVASTVAALQAQIDALKEDSSPTTTDTTRWNVDISTSAGFTVSLVTFPSRVEEDDYYEVDITIERATPAKISAPLTITLTPVSRTASVFINEGNTYVEDWSTTVYTHSSWTTTVSAARDGAVRRITFTSTYTLPAQTVNAENIYYNDIELELSLAYK